MNYVLSPMIVTQVNLLKNNDKQPESDHTNAFSLDGSVHFDSKKNTTAKFVMQAELVAYGKYQIEIEAEFTLHFDTKVTKDDVQKVIDGINTEASVYPHVSAYMSAVLTLSGYPRPNIPIVLF